MIPMTGLTSKVSSRDRSPLISNQPWCAIFKHSNPFYVLQKKKSGMMVYTWQNFIPKSIPINATFARSCNKSIAVRTVLKEKQHLLHQFDTTLSHHEECFTAAKRDGAWLDTVSLSLTALSCTFHHILISLGTESKPNSVKCSVRPGDRAVGLVDWERLWHPLRSLKVSRLHCLVQSVKCSTIHKRRSLIRPWWGLMWYICLV